MSEDDTNPGFTITPAMSELSRKKAEEEAFENAQRVVDDINKETADPNAPDGLTKEATK